MRVSLDAASVMDMDKTTQGSREIEEGEEVGKRRKISYIHEGSFLMDASGYASTNAPTSSSSRLVSSAMCSGSLPSPSHVLTAS